MQFSNTVPALADAMYLPRKRGPTHQDIPQHVLAVSRREWCLTDQTSAGPDGSKVAFDPIEPVACLALRTCEVVGVLGLRQTDHDSGSLQLKDRDVGLSVEVPMVDLGMSSPPVVVPFFLRFRILASARSRGAGLPLLPGLRFPPIACGSRHATRADPLRPLL